MIADCALFVALKNWVQVLSFPDTIPEMFWLRWMAHLLHTVVETKLKDSRMIPNDSQMILLLLTNRIQMRKVEDLTVKF